MKLTKQRKAYAALLGLAALAFAADRMFFLPAGASAAPAPVPEAVPAEAHAVAADAQPAEAVQATLAERLRLADSKETDSGFDPFRAKWRIATKPTEVKPIAASGQSPADYFTSTHKLTGVSKPKESEASKDDETAWAQIATKVGDKSENKTYKVGDAIDGWTLVSVTIDGAHMSATLESPAGNVTLRMARASKPR